LFDVSHSFAIKERLNVKPGDGSAQLDNPAFPFKVFVLLSATSKWHQASRQKLEETNWLFKPVPNTV